MAGRTVDMEKVEKLGKLLYQHQNFNNAALRTKLSNSGAPYGTIITYMSGLRNFLRTGNMDTHRAPKEFYRVVQNCKDTHCGILTPAEQDKLRDYSQRTKRGPNKSSKVKTYKDETLKTSSNMSGKIELSEETRNKIIGRNNAIGVLYDNKIILVENEDMLKGFLMFSDLIKGSEFKVIDLSYKIR